MTRVLDEVRYVTDDELLSRLERLVKADRALSVKLLVHLGEVEARKLYLERGYSSMYSYCMTALGMSEAETYLRLLAAKTGKRFPLVLERLADGGLHLTAIKLLAPLLTESNHVALLERARGMSKRQLEVLVAELAPQPDVPERMRKLPEPRGSSVVAARLAASLQAVGATPSEAGACADVQAAADGGVVVSAAAFGGTQMVGNTAVDSSDAPHACGTPAALSQASMPLAAAPFALQPPAARGSTSPLSPGRFKLELTLGQEAHDQLEQLRELLRHQNPSGEITSIVERALRELLERTLKRRFAQGAPRRQSARARDAEAPDSVAESTAGAAADAREQSACSTEGGEWNDAAPSDAPSAAGHQPPDAEVAVSTAGAAAGEPQPGRWADGRALEDAAPSDAPLAAGHQLPDADVAASAADARELQSACSTEGGEQDDAAPSDAPLAADHQQPVVHAVGSGVVVPPLGSARSRYVPRDVLREVYARDAGRCSFVSADGRRCSAIGFLEVHHHLAFARGGEASVGNLRLACRAHNFWLAERELGVEFVQRKLRQARLLGCSSELCGE
jgi:hypothetical protein